MCNYLAGKSYNLIAKSLLYFEENLLSDVELPKIDILFFASSRSFDFYVKQREISKELIACAGEATAKYIQSKGYQVSFFPDESGKVSFSAQLFSDWVGDKAVGFSVSNLSKQSYASQLDPSKVFILPTYTTKYRQEKITPCSVYVFTSPSNVDAFLKANEIHQGAKVVAWGDTTAQHLHALNIDTAVTLTKSDDSALVEWLDTI